MKKSDIVFGNLAKNSAFARDIYQILSISKEKLDNALNIFLKSKYRTYYHIHFDKFSEITKLSQSQAHSFIHVLQILGYVIESEYKVEEILTALSEIVRDKKVEKLHDFVTKLKSKNVQEILENLDLVDEEIGTINPYYKGITFNIQNRIVLKDGKIIKKFPVVILQIITSEENNGNILELLDDDLDTLISGLNEIKEKLKYLGGIKNESTNPKFRKTKY